MSDSAIPYTNYRVALATAILGSIGTTIGWIIVLAIKAGDSKMVITILVGAAVGLAAHWTQHYIRVALRERSGDGGGHSTRQDLSGHPLIALLWAGAFAFLGLAAEDLIAHLVSEFFRPFLTSFASLLPAGAIIGWTMSRGRPKDENLLQLIASGLFVGAAIAVISGIIWTLGEGDAPWLALLAWWGLLGICARALTRPERNAVRVGDPIAAVALMFAMTFLLNMLPVTISAYDKLGPLKSLSLTLRILSAKIQLSPAIPAASWIAADRKLAIERGLVDTTHVELPRPKARAIDTSMVGGALHVDLARAVDSLTAPPPIDDLASRWSSITHASWPELARSWLVIALFALGVGLAPRVEQWLRPIDYPNSETYRRDIELSLFMALLLALAVTVAHFGPKAPQKPAQATVVK